MTLLQEAQGKEIGNGMLAISSCSLFVSPFHIRRRDYLFFYFALIQTPKISQTFLTLSSEVRII
jgi:hypothetical protein